MRGKEVGGMMTAGTEGRGIPPPKCNARYMKWTTLYLGYFKTLYKTNEHFQKSQFKIKNNSD